jgi:hypothetical protein
MDVIVPLGNGFPVIETADAPPGNAPGSIAYLHIDREARVIWRWVKTPARLVAPLTRRARAQASSVLHVPVVA